MAEGRFLKKSMNILMPASGSRSTMGHVTRTCGVGRNVFRGDEDRPVSRLPPEEDSRDGWACHYTSSAAQEHLAVE